MSEVSPFGRDLHSLDLSAKHFQALGKDERLSSAIIFLPALLLIVPVSGMAILGSFDGLYGQDPFAYYDYATGPLRWSLQHFTLPPPFFWPPGYPILVGLVSLVTGAVPLAGQIVSLVSGGLVPVFTALLAREVWRRQGQMRSDRVLAGLFVPLVAGLVVALNGQLWQSSVVVMSDTTGVMSAVLGFWTLARYRRRGSAVWLVLAGVALSWAILTRWVYVVVAVPCAIYAISVLAHRGRRVALVHGTAAILVSGAILGPTVVSAITGLFVGPEGAAPFIGTLEVYKWQTWQPLHILQREFSTTGHGHFRYQMPNGLYYALAPAHQFFFTPLIAPLILPGLWAIVRRRAYTPLLLIVGWAAIVYGFHAGTTWQNLRYNLAYLPPLAILVAIGVESLYQGAGRHLRWLTVLALVVGLAWMTSGGVLLTQRFIERKQADLATVRWVEIQTSSNARLLSFSLTLTFQHYSEIETLELFEFSPAKLADLVADGRETLVLIDIGSIEDQWLGQPPSENYRWLRDGPGLLPIGKRGQYELLRVGASQ